MLDLAHDEREPCVSAQVENRPWSIEESAAVFLETIRIVLEERSAEVGLACPMSRA